MISSDFLEAIAQEHHLSKAEQEVLVLAMQGKPTAAIAAEIGISGDAVRKRLSEVYQKFQISGRGPVKLTRLQQLLVSRYQAEGQSPAVSPPIPASGPVKVQPTQTVPAHHWGEAPDSGVFYGRGTELAQLQQWLLQEQCRLVIVLGMAGIGKTALAVKLARQIAAEFEAVIWLSLRQAPVLSTLLEQVAEILTDSDSHNGKTPKPLEAQVSDLLDYCRAHRCLLVLDGAESILQSGRLAGIYREGYEDYGELFKRLGQEPHQSSVLITSQEKPAEISLLEGEIILFSNAAAD
ncbi:MAG: AAA family ATPase [Leptolyngbya sp. SIO4C5]|nr:AAA family ATPase [Leptolyngbya sp. SIO4C5]